MRYYSEVSMMQKAVDQTIKAFVDQAKKIGHGKINIASLIMDVTTQYEVSQLSIMKRIKLNCDADDTRCLRIQENYLVYEQ
jgi:hypothetical protein